MKRIIASCLLAIGAATALAQPVVTQTITTQNLSATGDCTAGSCVVVDMTSKGGASVQVSGTYTASGGLSLQRTVNGTTWETISSNAFVPVGGTGNITFVYGTGTACGTGTTSLTGAYPLIANAGLTLGSGLGPVLVVPAGNALCVTTSAAVQMSGHVAYTQFTP